MKKTAEDMMVERFKNNLAMWKQKEIDLVEDPTDLNYRKLRKVRTRALEDKAILIDIFGWSEDQVWNIRQEYEA